jgi:hypothetical protein
MRKRILIKGLFVGILWLFLSSFDSQANCSPPYEHSRYQVLPIYKGNFDKEELMKKIPYNYPPYPYEKVETKKNEGEKSDKKAEDLEKRLENADNSDEKDEIIDLLKNLGTEKAAKILRDLLFNEEYKDYWEKIIDALAYIGKQGKTPEASNLAVNALSDALDSDTYSNLYEKLINGLSGITKDGYYNESRKLAIDKLGNLLNDAKFKDYQDKIINDLKEVVTNYLNGYRRWPPYPIVFKPLPEDNYRLSDYFKNYRYGRNYDSQIEGNGEYIYPPFPYRRWYYPYSDYEVANEAVKVLGDTLKESDPDLTEKLTSALSEIAKYSSKGFPYPIKPPYPPIVVPFNRLKGLKEGEDVESPIDIWPPPWYWRQNPFSYQILQIFKEAENENPNNDSKEIIKQAAQDLEDFLKDYRWPWRWWWRWPYPLIDRGEIRDLIRDRNQ